MSRRDGPSPAGRRSGPMLRPWSASTFDPTAPLPGPPDPWASTDSRLRRDGPPFHMTEMIAAEPSLAERVVTRHAAPDGGAARAGRAPSAAVRAGWPVVVTGCGTSEHGAIASRGDPARGAGCRRPGVGLEHAGARARAGPANGGAGHRDLARGRHVGDQRALSAARAAGASTAIITVSDRSPGAALAESSSRPRSWTRAGATRSGTESDRRHDRGRRPSDRSADRG